MEAVKTLDTPLRPRGFRQAALWAGAHPLPCAAAFFVLAFALRLLLGHWLGPILLNVYPDEFRYLHLAKSIAEGGPLLIRGLPASYQKILYPLLISPVFAIVRNSVAQVKIVEVINCLVMASTVFPTALLVKKLTPKPAVLLLTLAFVCALPDYIYTATFMCEPLYWPLCVWVFYLFHCAMAEEKPRRRLLWFALFGFFTWLAYLTKEVGAAFLIAGAAMLVIESIREKRWKQNTLALAASLLAFFAPFMIIRQALFSGIGNSYDGSQSGWDQIGLSGLKVPGAFGYMIYSAVALFVAAILSFYILPVLLPLFGLRKLDESQQRMYWFTMGSLVVTVGAMSYTVSIREAWGDLLPRMHMRLLAPIVIPFVVLCIDFLLSKDHIEQLKKRKRGQQKKQYAEQQKKKKRARLLALLLTGIFVSLMMIVLWKVPAFDEVVDHATLSVSFLTKSLVTLGMDSAPANVPRLAFLWFMAALAVAGAICLLAGKKKTVLIMLLCAVFSVSALDNVINYTHKRAEKLPMISEIKQEPGEYASILMKILFAGERVPAPDPLAHAAIAVDNYLRQTDGAPACEIAICLNLEERTHFDTYASQKLRAFALYPSNVRNNIELGALELVFASVKEMKTRRADYIIVSEHFNPFRNVEVVFTQSPYLVLRNFNRDKVCFMGAGWKQAEQGGAQ